MKLNLEAWRDKIPLLCTVAAAIGIAALVFYPRAGGGSETLDPALSRREAEDTSAYVEQLEHRLGALLAGINGVGEISIMVTLESGVEYVYATEQKTSANLLSDTLTNAQRREENSNGNEDSYIILKDANGAESPVLVKRLEPVVQGVAIVCSGAEDNVIRQKVLETTAIALGIPTTRVSVVSK